MGCIGQAETPHGSQFAHRAAQLDAPAAKFIKVSTPIHGAM
jgi:hypothetical protein